MTAATMTSVTRASAGMALNSFSSSARDFSGLYDMMSNLVQLVKNKPDYTRFTIGDIGGQKRGKSRAFVL